MHNFAATYTTAHMQAARPCEPHEADKLQQAAFVAIQEVVRSAASDALPLVGHLIPVVLAKLHETLTMVVNSAEDRERQSELQVRTKQGVQAMSCCVVVCQRGLLCSALGSCWVL